MHEQRVQGSRAPTYARGYVTSYITSACVHVTRRRIAKLCMCAGARLASAITRRHQEDFRQTPLHHQYLPRRRHRGRHRMRAQ